MIVNIYFKFKNKILIKFLKFKNQYNKFKITYMEDKNDDQQPGTPDSAEGREKEANAAKDPNFMPK